MPRHPTSEHYISVQDRHAGGERGPKRWRFRVWSKAEQRYRTRSFEDHAAGLAWARALRPQIETRQQMAKTASLAELRDLFVTRLENRSSSQRHRDQVIALTQRLIDGGATDPMDPDFVTRVDAIISQAVAARRGGAGGGRGRGGSAVRPLSGRTKNMCLGVVRALCRLGVRRRLLPYNPIEALDRYPEKAELRETFTVPELERLVADAMDDDPWYLYVCLAVYTGARSSEIRHLTWKLIDWERELLTLPADLPGNKSKTERLVVLQPELLAILRPRRGLDGARIVGSAAAAVTDSSVPRALGDYCRRAEVDAQGRTPHHLRHSWCAMMTASGMTTMEVMLQIGHSSAAVTKGYAREAMRFVRDVRTWGRGQIRLRGGSATEHVAHGVLVQALRSIDPAVLAELLLQHGRAPGLTGG